MIKDDEILLLEFYCDEDDKTERYLIKGKSYKEMIEYMEEIGYVFFGCTHITAFLEDRRAFFLNFDNTNMC